MKKQFLRTVSVLLFMAVLLPLASCKSEGQSALRQEFADNGKNQGAVKIYAQIYLQAPAE